VFLEAKDDGGGDDNWTTGAISHAKLQSNYHHQITKIQFFTDRMPVLSPNQQCQNNERKISHSMDLFLEITKVKILTYMLKYDILLFIQPANKRN